MQRKFHKFLALLSWIAVFLVTYWTLTAFPLGALAAECPNSTEPLTIKEAEVLATIDGNSITRGDLQERLGERLSDLEFQYRRQQYQLVETELKNLVQERLLEEEAKARGISKEELITAETKDKIQVTETDVYQWYLRNKKNLRSQSWQEVFPQIEQSLRRSMQDRLLKDFVKQLEAHREIIYLLEPVRADINIEDALTSDFSDAPITIIEFSDFECPFCRQFTKTLAQVKDNYGKQVRIVYKHYPLNIHPNAFKAAEASLCAYEQSQFWEMHDLLFAEQDQLGVIALKEKAGRLGLNRTAFDACLDSERPAEKIRLDMQQGNHLGVRGTPTIFINGIPMPSGALPYETVTEVIERELKHLRVSGVPSS